MGVITIRDIAISYGFEVDKASVKNIDRAVDGVKDKANRSIEEVNKNINNSAANFKKILGAAAKILVVAFSLTRLRAISEEFNGINDQIRDATRNLGDQTEIQRAILQSANNARQSYGDMADTVSRLARETGLFENVEQAAGFAELMYKNFLGTGKSAQQSHAMVQQLTQSISRGTFDARALNVVLRDCPGTVQMLADSLEVSTERLTEMANRGQISAETLRDAFMSNAASIEYRFGELDLSISDAILNIRNQWGLYIDEVNSSLRITQTIAQLMVNGFSRVVNVLRRAHDAFMRIAERMGGVDRLMRLIAIAAGAIFVAMNTVAILTFFRNLDKELLKFKLKILAIALVFLILALIIEDFVQFMLGNESVIGSIFEKMGIDGDAVREVVWGILDAIRGLLPFIIELGRQIGGVLLDGIMTLLPILGDLIQQLLPPLLAFVRRLAPMLMEFARRILPMLVGIVEMLIPFLIQIIEAILPVVVDLIMTLLPFLLTLVETILPVIFSIIEAVLPLLFSIIEAILPVIISLIEMILPLLIQIIEMVLPIIIELIEMLLPLIMEIINAVLPIIISLLETILPLLMTIVEAILPVINMLIETMLPLITQIIQSILPVVISLIETVLSILSPIIDLIGGLVRALLPPIASLLEAIVPILSAALSVLQPIATVLGVIVDVIGRIVGFVASGFTWVIDLITGGGSVPDVPGFATGSDNTPSTFVAGEKGPELITNAPNRKVFTAAETGDIFQTISNLAKLNLSPSPATMGGMASSIENKTVIQNIEMVNQFNGDRAGQQRSSEAMEKAGDDLTGYLARGLAYVR